MNINIPKGKFLLAFSGGVDSSVLLHLLLKKTKNIVLAHINHRLRPWAGNRDESFSRKIAKKYGLEILVIRLDKKPMNEEAAREERYKHLFKLMEKTQADYLALAQHKSDQIETLLLQLIRGTHAFSPMEEFSPDGKWRPLLDYSKEEIYAYAKLHNLKWREDKSNKDVKYSRNRLRNIIIPQIKEINPSFETSLLRFAKLTGDNAEHISNEATDFIKNNSNFSGISRKEFLKLSVPVKRSVIKLLKPDLYSIHIEEIIDMIDKGVGKKQKHGVKLSLGKIVFMSK